MISKEELHDMYWGQGMSAEKIAKEIGVSQQTVLNWIQKYGIKTRTLSESRRINISIPSKSEIEEMYFSREMSTREIAKEIGVYQRTVCIWMQSHGIKSRTNTESLVGRFTGENAGNWNGGTSFEPYCNKFNNTFKEAIRERDDYTCQLCGYEQKSGGQKLSVHHIHYDKENCYPDVVALCHSCNGRVNGDRIYWEQYFEEQLLQRGLLNWSST